MKVIGSLVASTILSKIQEHQEHNALRCEPNCPDFFKRNHARFFMSLLRQGS